jgi:CRISPR-associated protein Csx3
VQHFPAVMIGGPPNSGKSILAYNLSQALRKAGVQHYVLRAAPDGEGDWAHEADQALVRTILVPQKWTPDFVEYVCQSLDQRHLPLIVDVGGRPASWQEIIFDHCTHAILLTPDEASRMIWQALVVRHNLVLLADLHSELQGPDVVTTTSPILIGKISGLERGVPISSPTFEALVECIAHLFDYDPGQLRRSHLATAPVETSVDLDRLAHSFGIPFEERKAVWSPRHLSRLLSYLPQGEPLGLYGRGPNWLFTAVALHAQPATFYQFDVRLGWVAPPELLLGLPPSDVPLQCSQHAQANCVELKFTKSRPYLDYSEILGMTIPIPPLGKYLILNSQIPHWLLTGLAIAYRNAPLLAVYQPQAGKVVVSSHVPEFAPGDLLA